MLLLISINISSSSPVVLWHVTASRSNHFGIFKIENVIWPCPMYRKISFMAEYTFDNCCFVV